MTLRSDGRIGGRRFSEVTDPDTGRPDKFICMVCRAETEADPSSFEKHLCANYKKQEGPIQKEEPKEDRRLTEEDVKDGFPDMTDSARDLANDLGLSPGDFVGRYPSGMHGFTVADVRAIASDVSEPEEVENL